MKIFIAGARSINHLDELVRAKLLSICKKNFDVLVGDCYGVDTAVQQFYADLKYKNVVVYSAGRTRNNIDNWHVRNIQPDSSVQGFDLYKQKDMAMAEDANFGFMIWDGESRGTLNNIINLISQDKKVLIYLTTNRELIYMKDSKSLEQFIQSCVPKTQILYVKLCNQLIVKQTHQVSFNI